MSSNNGAAERIREKIFGFASKMPLSQAVQRFGQNYVPPELAALLPDDISCADVLNLMSANQPAISGLPATTNPPGYTLSKYRELRKDSKISDAEVGQLVDMLIADHRYSALSILIAEAFTVLSIEANEYAQKQAAASRANAIDVKPG